MTDDEKLIAQSKNYAIAMGRDPESIKTIDDARALLQPISDQCAEWGCD